MRKAKILATLGPASRDGAMIEALLTAGANGVRVNMSHGTREEKAADIRLARAIGGAAQATPSTLSAKSSD